MGHALPGGLYDPRLGTTDRTVPCTTCALPHADCPGHFAHIELAVPVYHPILFMDIVQFLRYKCVNCHKFQAPPRLLAIHRAKFHLLYQHETQRLLELDEELAQAAHSAMDASESLTQKKSVHRVAAGKAMDQVLRSLQPSSSPSSSEESVDRVATSLNSYEMQLRKELIQACVQDCKRAKRCEHCGCYNPKIRQDSANKIFQVELSKQYKKRNAQDGIKLVSALTKKKDNNYDSDDSAHERRARDLTEGSDVEEDDEEDSEEGDSEVDDNDEDRPTTSKQDKFMHPAEIEAQLARTWKIDPFLCNCLFGGGPSTDVNGYKIFFLRAVPVPPSRFRPAMHLNGMSVEHSQTQYLSKMISLNDLLRTQFASGDEDRAYSTWIELQTNVNCFMDSSKYPGAATANQIAPGIRQILERKEGLFRKNMMGKRVDYACRSVISPDPYVGTNEIGLPRYFATVLTYPTPVIDLNIKEMRQLVERGVEYPGARWVEISGKRVDLSKMKKHKREAIAAQLLTHIKKGGMPALVGRQLRDGDYVLMNRQVGFYFWLREDCLLIPRTRYQCHAPLRYV
jgi:DNA-directed RNA polymerase I subunit RPA1